MNIPKLPIGISDFRKLRRGDYYYADKTLFIREIIDASAEVLLIPRPRRFGKTLNLSMLKYFFEKTGEDCNALFQDLAISGKREYKVHQGRYPVICLTFKDIKDMAWEPAYRGLTRIIQDEFIRHRSLLESGVLADPEKRYFEAVMNNEAGSRDYADSLRYLSSFLHRHHEESVVILIDEYDTPLHAGYDCGYYKEIINFMRNLLSGGLKDNVHLFKGILTGILRVAKESVFSGLNNLGVYTLLDKAFNTSFGFTESEVRELLNTYCLAEKYDEVSLWYNGYLFGQEVVYNPWSVVNYVENKNQKPRPYWVNTADTGIIDRLATRGGRELREEIGQLIEARAIDKPVYDSIVMRDLDTRDDLLWSFLVFSGYLKPVEQTGDEKWKLAVPNHEVHLIYRNLVQVWFAEKVESERLEDMLNALETGDIPLFEQLLQKIVLQVMSFHDLSGEPEKVYHALVLGMLVRMSDKYEIRSNRESGYGRYDIMLRPKDISEQGIVIEFKKVDKSLKETPEQTLERALKQIEDRKYETELKSCGVRNILKVAVAFRGKELWVKKADCKDCTDKK